MANTESSLHKKLNNITKPIIKAVSDNRIEIDRWTRRITNFEKRMADIELVMQGRLRGEKNYLEYEEPP
jgi:predicted RNA-binding protein